MDVDPPYFDGGEAEGYTATHYAEDGGDSGDDNYGGGGGSGFGGFSGNNGGNDDNDEVIDADDLADMATDGTEGQMGGVPLTMGDDEVEYVPEFPALKAQDMSDGKSTFRRVTVPQHRYSPLRDNWDDIVAPIVQHMLLQIRMNLKTRSVEIRTSEFTEDPGALQKAEDFVRAFLLGFELQDAIALLRMDDLFVDSFLVTDVKPLKGDHLSRAIGRIAGKNGQTKFAVENTTKTRIVLADQRIHILGTYQNIRVAKRAVCNLILGQQPGKVYGSLRTNASRLNTRF